MLSPYDVNTFDIVLCRRVHPSLFKALQLGRPGSQTAVESQVLSGNLLPLTSSKNGDFTVSTPIPVPLKSSLASCQLIPVHVLQEIKDSNNQMYVVNTEVQKYHRLYWLHDSKSLFTTARGEPLQLRTKCSAVDWHCFCTHKPILMTYQHRHKVMNKKEQRR